MNDENQHPELLNKLASGYGYPGGVETMPDGLGKTCRKLFKAIVEADLKMLQEILHPDNKRSREAFDKLLPDNVRLPKTVKATYAWIDDFVAQLQAGFAKACLIAQEA